MIDEVYIKKILTRIPELETELSDPATAANQKLYQKLVREHVMLTKLGKLASDYFNTVNDIKDNRELIATDDTDPELKEMAEAELKELEVILPDVEKKLKMGLLPPDPNDSCNAIVEVRAGTGGDEASLFAADLFRMYSRYAEEHGWKIVVLDMSMNEIGGYKEVVFQVDGENAFGVLKYESGGQRVQRVPSTESQGRVHTSAATVAVFPDAGDDDADFEIDPADLRIDVYRASGPGGQCVNTTDSAVRLTHIPTGTVVQCQNEKSQHKNKAKAMSVLKSRILDKMRQEEAAKMGDVRRDMIGSGDRSERVRTYNFPQNRLTDHRINLTLYSLDRVMEGDLEQLFTALREHDTELRLKAELDSMAG
jgi:peptide chain release factor 1